MKRISSIIICIAISIATFAQVSFSGQNIVSTSVSDPRSVFTADIDGDGFIDILSASRGDDKIAWYKNNGDGSFGSQQIIIDTANGASFVCAAKIDNDDYIDVVSTSQVDKKVAWYKNDGSGNFGPQQVISDTSKGLVSVTCMNFQGSDYADVITSSYTDGTVSYYVNDGNGNFGFQNILTDSIAGVGIIYVGGIEDPLNMDIIIPSLIDNKISIFYENSGLVEDFLDFENPSSVITASIQSNYNGLDDIIVGGDTALIYIPNNGPKTFGAPVNIADTIADVKCVLSFDIDGDGDDDVISASGGDISITWDKIAWYENDGDGNFSSRKIITTWANGLIHINSADLDNDGDIDIVSASVNDNEIAWYETISLFFTEQPSDQTYCESTTNTFFKVKATDPDSYQWEVDEGLGFSVINNGGIYSGTDTDSLILNGTDIAMNGNIYRCVILNANGSDTSNTAILNIDRVEDADAGLDDTICDVTDYVLNANASIGSWSSPDAGLVFEEAGINSTNLVSNLQPGENMFIWERVNSCGTDNDTVYITRDTSIIATTGADDFICDTSKYTITANPPLSGTGMWTISNITVSIDDSSANTTIANNILLDTTDFIWTITNGICVSKDTLKIIKYFPIASVFPKTIYTSRGESVSITVSIDETALSYQWQENGFNISNSAYITGANTQTLVVTVDPYSVGGIYSCIVETECGLSYSDSSQIWVSYDIEEDISNNNLVIYPNPNNGAFTISYRLEESAILKISDISGKRVYFNEIKNSDPKINLTGFEKGLYFIKIQSNKQTSFSKLIIK